MASKIPCLVCNKLIIKIDDNQQRLSLSSHSSCSEDKRITLFLLRNLLEFPKSVIILDNDNGLKEDNEEKNSLNICSRFLVTCGQCKEAVKQASLIYGEIRELVKKFRGIQKIIVESVVAKSGTRTEVVSSHDVTYCRKLVNGCDYNDFGFPFVVQDKEEEIVDHEVASMGVSSTNIAESNSKPEPRGEVVVVKQEEDDNNGKQEILLLLPEEEEEDDDSDDGQVSQVSRMASEEEEEDDDVSEGDYQVSDVDSEVEEDDNQNDSEEAEEDIKQIQNSDVPEVHLKDEEDESVAPPPTQNLLSSFICKKCLQRFDTIKELEEHDKTFHLKEEKGTFPCPLEGCSRVYTSSSKLPQHFRLHHRRPPFICKDCKQEFSNPNQVSIHHKKTHPQTQTQTQPPPQPVKKLEIHKTKDVNKLQKLPKKPAKVKVPKKPRGRPPKPQEQQPKPRINPHYPFPCPLCHRNLQKFSSLTQHMKRKHPTNTIPLNELRLKFFSPSTSKPPDLPEVRKFTNPLYKFLGVSTFELEYPHIICKRNADRKFPCPWTDPSPCPKIFAGKDHLHRHIKVKHLNLPLYTCTWSGGQQGEEGAPVCGRTFSTRHNYQEHYDEHRGTPKYKCEDCGLTFYRRNPFTRHQQKMHLGVKYICEVCGRKYSCQEYLNLHRTMKHTENSKKDGKLKKKIGDGDAGSGIICEICGKLYKFQSTLKAHMEAVHEKVPGRYCCHLCDKRFRVSTYLNMHLWERHDHKVEGFQPRKKVARKDKLQCPVKGCRMLFMKKENFEKHRIDMHGDDGKKLGPWKCKYCGKNYFWRVKWQHCERTHENRESRPEKCEVCGKGFPTKDHLRFHQRNTHKMELESYRGRKDLANCDG